MFQTNMTPLLSSLQFQDSEFASLSGGRVVRIAVNPDYQGVRSNKRLQRVNPSFSAVLVTCLQHSAPDGLRLQSSSAAADVLWGQVPHHGREHAVKSQRDHLRQQRGNAPTGSRQTSEMQFLKMRWGRSTVHLVVCCCLGCQSAGGGDHSTEEAPSSAAEAQREESRETGLSRRVVRSDCTAAQVSFLTYREADGWAHSWVSLNVFFF